MRRGVLQVGVHGCRFMVGSTTLATYECNLCHPAISRGANCRSSKEVGLGGQIPGYWVEKAGAGGQGRMLVMATSLESMTCTFMLAL